MNLLLILAFLFFVGSLSGWVLELLYRRFFSKANPGHHWINPGFCTGPYLPIYGTGLCILYLIGSIEKIRPGTSKLLLLVIMGISMTAIEYIAGIWSLKKNKVRLWDYTKEWGNIQGIICPKFSLIWTVLGAGYYILIHPHILNALDWLSRNLAFSFFIGMFFGVFIIDFAHSARIVYRLKAFAEEHDVVLRYEAIKIYIRREQEQRKKKYHFFRPFHSELPVTEHLTAMLSTHELRIHRK